MTDGHRNRLVKPAKFPSSSAATPYANGDCGDPTVSHLAYFCTVGMSDSFSSETNDDQSNIKVYMVNVKRIERAIDSGEKRLYGMIVN